MSTAHNMLPPQAAPIDRTPAGAAAFRSQAGVGASAFWDKSKWLPYLHDWDYKTVLPPII
jgi:hypothetical protein